MSEAVTLKKVMIEASKLGLRVFRNQVGLYKLHDGRYLRSGLCVGSADLIGWMPNGCFVAIEVKAKDAKASDEQKNFCKQVKKAGGFACIIDDETKLKKYVQDFLKNVEQTFDI